MEGIQETKETKETKEKEGTLDIIDLKMIKHNYKKLTIWQDGMNVCDLIYSYTETLPLKEKYNLISQLEKCSVSIPSNIAEGSGKRTNVHFAEFLTTALTSAYEMETQLLICERRKYGSAKELKRILSKVEILQTQISNFRDKILNQK